MKIKLTELGLIPITPREEELSLELNEKELFKLLMRVKLDYNGKFPVEAAALRIPKNLKILFKVVKDA